MTVLEIAKKAGYRDEGMTIAQRLAIQEAFLIAYLVKHQVPLEQFDFKSAGVLTRLACLCEKVLKQEEESL